MSHIDFLQGKRMIWLISYFPQDWAISANHSRLRSYIIATTSMKMEIEITRLQKDNLIARKTHWLVCTSRQTEDNKYFILVALVQTKWEELLLTIAHHHVQLQLLALYLGCIFLKVEKWDSSQWWCPSLENKVKAIGVGTCWRLRGP